jgi:hypothetical protein
MPPSQPDRASLSQAQELVAHGTPKIESPTEGDSIDGGLLNDLVSKRDQGASSGEPDVICSLEIDHQLELSRSFNR